MIVFFISHKSDVKTFLKWILNQCRTVLVNMTLENIGILKPPEVLNFLCMKLLAGFKDHHIVTKLSCLDLTWFGTIVLNQAIFQRFALCKPLLFSPYLLNKSMLQIEHIPLFVWYFLFFRTFVLKDLKKITFLRRIYRNKLPKMWFLE